MSPALCLHLQGRRQNGTWKLGKLECIVYRPTLIPRPSWMVSSHDTQCVLQAARRKVRHCACRTYISDTRRTSSDTREPPAFSSANSWWLSTIGHTNGKHNNLFKPRPKWPSSERSLHFQDRSKLTLLIHIFLTADERRVRWFTHKLRQACTSAAPMTPTLNPCTYHGVKILVETTTIYLQLIDSHLHLH